MKTAARVLQLAGLVGAAVLLGVGLAMTVASTFLPVRGLGLLWAGIAVCLAISTAPEAVPFAVGVVRKLRARREES